MVGHPLAGSMFFVPVSDLERQRRHVDEYRGFPRPSAHYLPKYGYRLSKVLRFLHLQAHHPGEHEHLAWIVIVFGRQRGKDPLGPGKVPAFHEKVGGNESLQQGFVHTKIVFSRRDK